MKSTIHIDLGRTLGAIDRNLFGGFAEHLGRCIYGGLYDPESPRADARGFRTDVLAALRRLRMPVLRYPGGNFVSGYRWRDGVGPRDARPARLDLAWHDVEPNAFGTNEFVQVCREIGAEPYLAVNCGDGDMREARDWVEYCNGTEPTALVKLRQSHGSEAPHRVIYWGIGNEVDGPWQIGAKTPEEYARAFTEFGKAMKWVDGSIKLLASATSFWDPSFVERGQLLLEQASDLVDYMAIHWYVGNRENDFNRYMALSEFFEQRLRAYEGLISAMRLAQNIQRPIHIAVDEWNVWYRSDNENKLEEVYNLEDALVVAMQLNAFIRHASTVKMANLAQIVNVIAPVVTNREGLFLQTIYHPFELYSRLCGNTSLDLYSDGDTFDGGSSAGVPVLDVAGSLDAARSQVALFVVNRTQDAETDVELRLASGQFTGPVQVTEVNGPDIKAANSFDEPDLVKALPTRTLPVGPDGPVVHLTLAPHSVTVITSRVA